MKSKQIFLMIGTPEEFQGNERDVMIFTPSVDKDQKDLRHLWRIGIDLMLPR